MSCRDKCYDASPVSLLVSRWMAAAILTIATSEAASAAAPIKLNGALVAGGNVSPGGLQFSPDSSRVLYHADQTTNGVLEIYSVPSTGGAATKLNGPLVAGGNVASAGLAFSPDSSRVLYLADQTTNGVDEIFSVPSAGGAATKLNGPLVAGGNVSPFDLAFSPDSSRVLYNADQTTDGVFEIFIVPSAGGTAVKLNGPLVAGGNVLDQQFSPDGSRVLYQADQDTDGVNEIYVRVIEAEWNAGSGNWATDSNWNNSFAPDEVMQTVIDLPATVALTGTGRQAFSLAVGGGSGTSILELQSGAALTVSNGLTVADGGVVSGDVSIAADVVVNLGGEVRAGAGERLRISGGLSLSDSRLEAIGSSGAPAEVEVDGAASVEGQGLITGHDATLRFNSGLYSEGSIALSAGASDIFGDINNQGNIIVSGGATATFYDDVDQNATLKVSKVGSTTSVAVFFGALTGAGGSTGGGDLFIEGDLQPGNSAATVTFGNNVALGAGATLEIELGGLTPGTQYDRVVVDGSLALDGTLNISLIDSFTPAAGNAFDLLDWGTLSGTFDTLDLPPLSADLMWNSSQLYTAGVLRVALAGDYNLNGTVDTADYIVWRATHGDVGTALAADGNGNFQIDSGDYDVWRSHFGQGGSGAEYGASSHTTVPEPAAAVMFVMGLLATFFRQRAVLS